MCKCSFYLVAYITAALENEECTCSSYNITHLYYCVQNATCYTNYIMLLRLPAHTAIKSESPSNLGEGQGLKRSFDQIVSVCMILCV